MLTQLTRRPSVELEAHADAIIALAADYGISDLRVFGSSVRGEDVADSDIDLIGKVAPGRGYFAVGAFTSYVEELTGFPVDFVVDGPERPAFFDTTELVPL